MAEDKSMRSALDIQLSRNTILPIISNYSLSEFVEDPAYWLWRLSRYKHVSRLLKGKKHVCEIGCGDAFASPLIASCVEQLYCFDSLPELISVAKQNLSEAFSNISFSQASLPKDVDHITSCLPSNIPSYDALFALDVLEHIYPSDMPLFLDSVRQITNHRSLCIFGMPTIESQAYASEGSRLGHVNCLNKDEFQHVLASYYSNVVMLSVNDETLHTGFGPMSQYIIAICSTPLS